jgi:hypothetical protein
MALFVFALACLFMGCSTTPVSLKHPGTGRVVQCGPYGWNELRTGSVPERERGCIADYQRQGYERVPDP